MKRSRQVSVGLLAVIGTLAISSLASAENRSTSLPRLNLTQPEINKNVAIAKGGGDALQVSETPFRLQRRDRGSFLSGLDPSITHRKPADVGLQRGPKTPQGSANSPRSSGRSLSGSPHVPSGVPLQRFPSTGQVPKISGTSRIGMPKVMSVSTPMTTNIPKTPTTTTYTPTASPNTYVPQ